MKFSTILKEQLESMCMAQKYLAEETNISASLICHYCKGDRLPNLRHFYEICDCLGMDPTEILNLMFGGKKEC